MHFEILAEDQSGKKALDIIVHKLIGDHHTFKVHSYKGIGRIPQKLTSTSDVNKRILLDQLPRLIRGYGNTFAQYPVDFPAVVIIVCDLDDKCLKTFRRELSLMLDSCSPKPETRFCIAIEEGEAWFLGDILAIRAVYPKAKESILNSYIQDSICGTWEKLADAVFPGGSQALKSQGWQSIGKEKSVWSEKITPYMDMNQNESPSFRYFRKTIFELARNVA